MSKTPHSAPVLTELRDQWWSRHYLRLSLGERGILECRIMADIGSGQGHWGQLLLPLLPDDASLEGIDLEAKWVEKARVRAQKMGLGKRCQYQEGKADSLPWQDNAFDLVTCQTLLMHVADPSAVLCEMLRVLKPGGYLLLAEPNNVSHQFGVNTASLALSAEELGDIMILLTACSRGRTALGRGDDCIGEMLPSMLRAMRLKEIVVSQNSKVDCIGPPYDLYEKNMLEQESSHAKKKFWLWDKEDAALLYAAGGGEVLHFEKHYASFLKQSNLRQKQVQDGVLVTSNGSMHYLISARHA